MHNALQHYLNVMLAYCERNFAPKQVLISFFNDEMRQRKSYFPEDEYNRRLAQGQQNLGIFYDQYKSSWVNDCRTELRLQNIEIEGVPLKGVIDRVDFLNDQELRIVDYKTGSHKADKIRAPKPPNNVEGGTYWRQLIFYKLLMENKSGEHRKVTTACISYLDLDKQGQLFEHQVNVSQDDIRQFKQLLVGSYRKIIAQDFYTGCGKETCEWCRFVNENIDPPSVSSEDIENLDDKMPV